MTAAWPEKPVVFACVGGELVDGEPRLKMTKLPVFAATRPDAKVVISVLAIVFAERLR